MNIKKATNSQLSTTESKTNQTTRIGTESLVLRSFRGLSVGRKEGGNEGKGTGIKEHKW